MSEERDAGIAAWQRGDAPAAVAALERACQADPNDFDAHLYLGAAYSQINRGDDAMRVLTQAVHLQPTNPQARYNLGVAMERAGWPNEALAVMQQVLTLQPDYSQAQEAIRRIQQRLMPIPQPPPLPTGGPLAGSSAVNAAGSAPAPDIGLAAGMTAPTAPSAGTSAAPMGLNAPGTYAPPTYAQPFAGPPSQPAPGGVYGMQAPPTGTVGALPPMPTSNQSGYAQRPIGITVTDPNVGAALLTGILLGILCGVVFGFASVAVHFRIPLLTIAIGYIMGYAVLKASGQPGPAPGVIAGVSAVLSTLVGLGIMYLAGVFISPLALLIVAYAGFRAHRIASGG